MPTTENAAGQITFRSTVTMADGTVGEGTCTEAHARRTLRKAVQRGYRVEATRNGGAVIVRDIPTSGDVWRPARKHTVTLEPVTATGTISATARHDLEVIADRPNSRLTGGRIRAGYIYSIPPFTTARLMQRGLVTVEGDIVSVSLPARLAMLAQDHRTGTQEPRGYVHPANGCGVERKGNKVYDRTSVASCPCRWSYPAEDRDDARRRAHEHRQEVTASMLRTLEDAA